MADITAVFNTALKAHNAPPVTSHRYSIDRLDEFLKEAYSINARIADLTTYLRAIRPSYLSTAPAPRRPQRQNSTDHKSTQDTAQRHLSDTERAAIDAEAKTVLRQLHAAVERIGQTEQIRQDTASHVALRKRNQGGLGAIGRWAAGGAVTAKSAEEELEEARQKMLNAHREGIVWYLQAKLRETGTLQSTMMEIRIQREVEKSKSVLYKTKGSSIPFSQSFDAAVDSEKPAAQEQERAQPQLSDEQMQIFAQENQDMMKHYQDTLDQVRTAERSLIEISELQSTLVTNLTEQNEHIEQLVQDSFFTTENIGRGNKELKKASERPSTARLLFHGTCAFCAFLVVWDLIF
ncbi:snare protein syntaxin-like protein 18/UFE1 [Aureobasidium pullulans]|uniref:Snare protein syntaxin-like protein 18/UFE1 n=1 Tax=Aureobasidium pullulans TaxID=5580 RepID=A0A4S8VUI2_AURPU|nr:snare protein syntaxin-like protein 18/UFE1 [Aureobasidium pullulans]